MKNTRKTLPIVTFLLIILLSFGCQSKKNAQYIKVITSPAHLNIPAINTNVSKDLEMNWFTKLFTMENLNVLINAGMQAASGNPVGAGGTLLLAASTAFYALRDKKKGKLLNEVREVGLKEGLDLITNLTNTKKTK